MRNVFIIEKIENNSVKIRCGVNVTISRVVRSETKNSFRPGRYRLSLAKNLYLTKCYAANKRDYENDSASLFCSHCDYIICHHSNEKNILRNSQAYLL